MGLTKTVLKRPVSTLLLLLAIIVFGISSLTGFRLEQLPDMDMPVMLVMTVYPGADPESVDKLVTTEIEGAAKSLSGVEEIVSMSNENYSMVMLQYEYNSDSNSNYIDLRSALDSLSSSLPEDVQDPIIMEMNMNAMPVIMVTATAEEGTDVLNFLDEGMLSELEALSSVAQVQVNGGDENYIRILLKEDMMSQYGLTISSVANYIAATDFSIPIGSLEQGSQSLSVNSSAANETIQELQRIPLYTATGSLIQLSDVADISWSVKDAESIARHNGNDTVSISVTKNQSAGTLDVSKDVNKLVEKYQAETDDITFAVTYDGADTVKSSLSSVAQSLVLAVILSMLVLFVFFGDLRASLVVGSSMPISLFIALILMQAMGFSLNVVTLGSLVIAVGMMVDNSIVVLESCFRAKQRISDYKEAALQGTKEVLASVIASTVTTCVVYIPLATTSGMTAQLFAQLGFTIVFAMCASLLSAVTFVPLFFTLFKPSEKTELRINIWLNKFRSWYDTNVRKIMHRKKIAVVTVVLLLVGSIGLAAINGAELMPQSDDGTLTMTAAFRSGTKLSEIDEESRELEALLEEYEDIESYDLTVGGSMLSGSSSASISIHLKDDRKMSTNEIKEDLILKTQDITNMDIDISTSSAMSSMMTADSGQIIFEGYDLDDVKAAASELTDRTREIPGAISVSNSADTATTKVELNIDPLLTASYGMTPVQVAGSLYGMVSGQEAMTITSDGNEYSVFLEFPSGTYDTANGLMNATLASPTGRIVPVSEIASLEYTDGQDTITKQGGRYQATIEATCLQKDLKDVQSAMDQLAAEMELPESVELAESSLQEMMGEEFSQLGIAIATAIFLIFLVMAIQFESPRFSIMVMMSLPFSFIGSFCLLFITGEKISMTSLMGLLMLVGIAVNNGILFVDTTNMLKEEHSVEDALVESGKIRVRPILMTTLTTILSMIPMAVSAGQGADMMRGMAFIIIGGLVTSTIMILLLMPCFYLVFDRRKIKKQRLKEEV